MLKPHVSEAHTVSFVPLCLNKWREFPNIYIEKSQQFKEMFNLREIKYFLNVDSSVQI